MSLVDPDWLPDEGGTVGKMQSLQKVVKLVCSGPFCSFNLLNIQCGECSEVGRQMQFYGMAQSKLGTEGTPTLMAGLCLYTIARLNMIQI
jgi:hypothetical protein